MNKLFFAALLFFTVSCRSEENSNNPSNSENNTSNKGNSAGSNTIEMDTLHMDTSSQKSATGNGH